MGLAMQSDTLTGIESYVYPGAYKPFKHQETTTAFLAEHKKSFCFNEQGTGKTASSIWASDFLMIQRVVRRALIICPLSIMDSVWRDDIMTFAPHRTVEVAHGTPEKRRQIIEEGSDYVVINYDGVEIVSDAIAKGNFDLIIVDEATHYKNSRTTRWRVLNKLLRDDMWLWMMTGTPAAQSPLDAYGLAKFINPTAIPKFYGSFRDMVMTQVSRFKWIPKESSTKTVYKALQPAIRFTKEDCLDLPPMTYVKREVELTRQQNKYYKELKTKLRMEITGEEITAHNAAIGMNKLLQIASGAVYTDKGDVLQFDIKNRYKVLKEVIDEASRKVLVFVPFRHTIDLLKDKLTNDHVPTEVIRGDVPAHKRTEIFKSFQETVYPKVCLLYTSDAADE